MGDRPDRPTPLGTESPLAHTSGERRPYVLVLTGHGAGAFLPLRDALAIGRGSDCRIRVPDDEVSRRHAILEVDANGEVWLEDCGSRNGTFVNGRVVKNKREKIADGDRVQIGAETLLKVAWHDRLDASFLYSMQEGALRDALTGVHSRRYLVERLRGELSYAARSGRPVSVLVIDLDRHGALNREHGHAAGDRVLAQVARAVERDIRSEDVLARSGGDELAVVARGIDLDGAVALAERIRARVAALRVVHGAGEITTTVSIGVAANEEDVLERAERAKEAAREAGGDRVVRAA